MSLSLHFTLASNIDELLRLMKRSEGKGKWRKKRRAERKMFRTTGMRRNKDLVGSLGRRAALASN